MIVDVALSGKIYHVNLQLWYFFAVKFKMFVVVFQVRWLPYHSEKQTSSPAAYCISTFLLWLSHTVSTESVSPSSGFTQTSVKSLTHSCK